MTVSVRTIRRGRPLRDWTTRKNTHSTWTHNRVPLKIGHDFLFATFPESEAFPWFTAYFTFAGRW